MASDDLQSEIAAMLGGGGTPEDTSSEPEQEVDDPDVGEEEEEKLGEEGETEEVEEEKEAETDEAPSEESDLSAVKKELEELKKQLKEGKSTEKEAEPEAEPEVPLTPSPAKVDFDPFEGTSAEDVISNPEKFKEWSTGLRDKLSAAVQEAIYQNVPEMLRRVASEEIDARKNADDFYNKHSDLSEHKSAVAQVANSIIAADPDATKAGKDKFFEEVARMTRAKLGLAEKAKTAEKKEKTNPALAKKGATGTRRSQPAPELDGVDKEIQEMLNAIDT